MEWVPVRPSWAQAQLGLPFGPLLLLLVSTPHLGVVHFRLDGGVPLLLKVRTHHRKVFVCVSSVLQKWVCLTVCSYCLDLCHSVKVDSVKVSPLRSFFSKRNVYILNTLDFPTVIPWSKSTGKRWSNTVTLYLGCTTRWHSHRSENPVTSLLTVISTWKEMGTQESPVTRFPQYVRHHLVSSCLEFFFVRPWCVIVILKSRYTWWRIDPTYRHMWLRVYIYLEFLILS